MEVNHFQVIMMKVILSNGHKHDVNESTDEKNQRSNRTNHLYKHVHLHIYSIVSTRYNFSPTVQFFLHNFQRKVNYMYCKHGEPLKKGFGLPIRGRYLQENSFEGNNKQRWEVEHFYNKVGKQRNRKVWLQSMSKKREKNTLLNTLQTHTSPKPKGKYMRLFALYTLPVCMWVCVCLWILLSFVLRKRVWKHEMLKDLRRQKLMCALCLSNQCPIPPQKQPLKQCLSATKKQQLTGLRGPSNWAFSDRGVTDLLSHTPSSSSPSLWSSALLPPPRLRSWVDKRKEWQSEILLGLVLHMSK